MAVSWKDFARLAEDSDQPWVVKFGVAILPRKDHVVNVTIHTPKSTLSPTSMLPQMALSDEEVVFEFDVIPNLGTQMSALQRKEATDSFLRLWIDLFIVGDYLPGIVPAPLKPEGFRPPTPLNFTDEQRRVHQKIAISKTDVSPVFGQHEMYLGQEVGVVDADVDQNPEESDGVTYRQTWLRKISCPFCGVDKLDRANLYALDEPEEEYFGDKNFLVVCPSCDRVVESVEKDAFAVR